jgi:hypothetical protein
LLGAAWGALLKRARGAADARGAARAPSEDPMLALGAALGAGLGLLCSEAQPFVHHALSAQAWLVQPVRVAFRVGLVLVMLSIGWIWTAGARGRFALDLGKTSLRVYWAHMFFAYGVLGRPLQKHLDFPAWGLGALVLLAAMWALGRVSGTVIRSAALDVRT